jgi:predicted GNAT superfamily acetyltransferase
VERALRGEAQEFAVLEQVEVPAALSAWKMDDAERPKALAVQASNAEALEAAFAKGVTVLGYRRDDAGDGFFQLGRWDEDLVY